MIARLHYITQHVPGVSHAELAEEACRGGVRWVQLRIKELGGDQLKQAAMDTAAVCRKYGAKLIMNDHVHVAKEIGADGIHLGKDDMNVIEAKKILGSGFIVGGTANTFDDIVRLEGMGVDYIGLGPFRFTNTKEKLSPILGIGGYEHIMNKMQAAGISIPVVAIGGLNAEDIPLLMKAGVHGIAVSSAINLAKDRAGAAKEFIDRLASTPKEFSSNTSSTMTSDQ